MEILALILIMVFVYFAVTLIFAFFKALGEFLEALGEFLFSSDSKKEEPPQKRTFYEEEEEPYYPSPTWTYSPSKPESPYTKDWSSVSRRYKKERNWRCEKCWVNLSAKKHQRLLHVHHRDNNPKNNWNYNLIALCVICHSEQPGAGHKRLAGAITKDGRRREVEWLR